MAGKVLVVEDNHDIAELIRINLRGRHLDVDHVARGDAGLEAARSDRYDLVILDLMLPGMSGIDVCSALRRAGCYTPLLMLTARSSELDRVLGLEAGADDYLVKPFSVAELVARANAMIRRNSHYRAEREPGNQTICAGDLCLDTAARTVRCRSASVDLTTREFDLLAHFARHPGRVYSRDELLRQVWGHAYGGYEHTVNSHINRLRAKIERDPSKPDYVQTVWGVGYRFNERPAA